MLIRLCADAHAWGDTGHRVICEIAFRLVQADTRAAISKLIQSDTEFGSFSDACIYPDHPRKRAPEHYVNLARDSHGLTSDVCPMADKCVLTAILNDSKVLASKSDKPIERLIALKFLGHWVGDIHQPLHVSFEDDRGGNNIAVEGACGSGTGANLHSIWDTCLVEYTVGTDIQQAASELVAAITSQLVTQWNASQPRDWANESFALAEALKTGYCVRRGASCDQPQGSVQISSDYLNANKPVVKQQLQKAGVRLARMLDIAFVRGSD
jgi:hypothetical protein